jgi:ketosteroid isomerase-like protein
VDNRSPIDIIQSVYVAFASADLTTILGLCSADVVVTQDPTLPWGGCHVGHQGVTEFATQLISTTDSKVTIENLFQAGDDVVQYGRTRGTVRANGAPFDLPECHVWTVQGGQITRAQFFIDSAEMLSAIALLSQTS